MLMLSHDALETIYALGARAYPYECCGLLVGGEAAGSPSLRVVALPNEATGTGPASFRIDAERLRDAMDAAEQSERCVRGVFHSHPDAPPRPSRRDMETAWPALVYLIVSVLEGRATEARAWRLKDDRSCVIEESIIIEESPT